MKKKKLWKYITMIFTIAGIGLWIFSAVGMGMDSIIESGVSSHRTFDEPSSLQINNIVITSFDPRDLDQAQETTGSPNGICIGYNPSQGYGYWAMQLGYNDREPLTGFQVAILEHGNPTKPIYIGIMRGQLDPAAWVNWIWYGYLNPGSLPQKDVYYWVGADFSNNPIDIEAGEEWYIAVISIDPTTGNNHWAWGCNPDNPYPRGNLLNWDVTWKNIAGTPDFDGCFRTYTTEGQQPPQEPPAITITSNYQIISQFLGSLSLLGAVISGTKYSMVV